MIAHNPVRQYALQYAPENSPMHSPGHASPQTNNVHYKEWTFESRANTWDLLRSLVDRAQEFCANTRGKPTSKEIWK